MDVFLANEQEVPVDEFRLAALARHVLTSEDVGDSGELSVLLVTPDHMRNLNRRYAEDDYPTDVLSFPMNEDGDDTEDVSMLGDVVICPTVAGENARKFGHHLAEEMDVLLVHGILHLLGYDHQNAEEKSEMDRRQAELVGSFDPAQVT